MTIARQCELLDVCRSSLYYEPPPLSASNLAFMRRLDELHLEHPFLGARRLARMLQKSKQLAAMRALVEMEERTGNAAT